MRISAHSVKLDVLEARIVGSDAEEGDEEADEEEKELGEEPSGACTA